MNFYRFNFIYMFCAQFFENLVNEHDYSVQRSFEIAHDFVQDPMNIDEYIWEYKEVSLTIEDLNIVPMLLPEESDHHHESLFDR